MAGRVPVINAERVEYPIAAQIPGEGPKGSANCILLSSKARCSHVLGRTMLSSHRGEAEQDQLP